MKRHYAPDYFLNPLHPITVHVAGAGGTGSQVMMILAKISYALSKLEKGSLLVGCFDPKNVTEANCGRQLFHEGEIGMNKAVAICTRINRYFGTEWVGVPSALEDVPGAGNANIIITCTDDRPSRGAIWKAVQKQHDERKVEAPAHWSMDSSGHREIYRDMKMPWYWLDFGNSSDTGQAILGTIPNGKTRKVPQDGVIKLPTLLDRYPNYLKEKVEKQGPSCSLAEALERQDLLINPTLANLGMDLIWKLLRHGFLDHHGVVLNMETLQSYPIQLPGNEISMIPIKRNRKKTA